MTDVPTWESIFDPEKRVTAANLITESLIVNYLKWKKLPLPRSPFWQKTISEKSKTLTDLRKRYAAEISFVHTLLKQYHYAPLAKFVKISGAVGFRMVKPETRKRLMADLEKFARQYEAEGEISENRVADAMALPAFIEVKKITLTKGNSGLADL